MTAAPGPDLDTALIVGMASTAIPFARSREEEAERWLRILRLHGEAGVALQALGVSEAPLEALEHEHPHEAGGEDVLATVLERAGEEAVRRGSGTITSEDILRAVMDCYDGDFDDVLRVHGTDRDEVLTRLAEQHPKAA